jgi:hypothetical protein
LESASWLRSGLSRLYAALMAMLLAMSLTGLWVSLWAHVESLAGDDPGFLLRKFWAWQFVLFLLITPLVIEMLATKRVRELMRSPRWMRLAVYGVMLYYGVNFYVFLYWSVNHLDSSATWRMFSAGWLVLFSLTSVYYKVRLSESR